MCKHPGAPLFDYFPGRTASYPNILTTTAAISSTCLLRVIDIAARRAGATWFIHAGTHLGAALHGGPIPWDDDMDVMVDANFKVRSRKINVAKE